MAEHTTALTTSRLPALTFTQAWRLAMWLALPLAAYYATLFLVYKPNRGAAMDIVFPLLAVFFTLVYAEGVKRIENRAPNELRPVSIAGALAGAGMALAGLMLIIGGTMVLLHFMSQVSTFPDRLPEMSWTELLRSRAAALAVAVKEELIFRALLLRWFLSFLKPGQAVLLQALLFGAEHWVFGPMSVLNASLVGLTLGVLYLRTNNLWVVMGFHFAWDFFIYVLAGGFSAYAQTVPQVTQAQLGTYYLASFVACHAILISTALMLTRRPGRLLRPI